ncbi:MAG: recombinase family protein [Chelatococcus sp.]|nr:MAG: recombinase family protein [Chelatococcus sp.]
MQGSARSGKRAAIYARYSTDHQNDRSIEDQIELCRSYARRSGLTIVGEYSDRARTSATLVGREGVLDLMADARAGRFDVVIVEALDRISRDQEDLAGIFKRLRHANVAIEAVHDGVADAVQVGLRGLMGSIFLADLKAKTRRGMAGVIREGRSAGGRAYGYRPIAGRPGELEIVEDEAAVIRRIFDEYLSGSVTRDIAARLNRDGIAPPRGALWNASTINGNSERGYGLLQNAAYDGRIVWNRVHMVRDPDTGRRLSRLNPESEWQTTEAEHLRIVPEEVFAAAQERKKARSHAMAEGKMARRPKRILSGLMRCGCCGGSLSMHDTMSGRPRVRCSTNRESGACTSAKKFYLDRIEEAVVFNLRGIFEQPAIVADYLRTYREAKRAEIAEAVRNRTRLERRLIDVTGQIDRLLDLYSRGVIEVSKLEERVAGLQEAQREAQDALKKASADIPVIELHEGLIAHYRANIAVLADRLRDAALDLSAPKEVAVVEAFRAMIDHIVVSDGADGKYVVEVVGPLSALTGDALPDGGKALVAGEGLEPPTRGL